jgi:hypothetical protein
MPPNTVSVARPGKWGNPFTLMDAATSYPSLTDIQVAGMVVSQFRDLIRADGRLEFPNWMFWGGGRGPRTVTYPGVEEIRAELAGKNLACWCDLSDPCHGAVLLEVANG